jgi:hypothetical protein
VLIVYFTLTQLFRHIDNPINISAATADDGGPDCRESLTIYDSFWADGRKVVKTFCDGFSRPLEKFDFVSTGDSLTVNFVSRTGSYSGSSLQYWAQYDFFDTTTDGQRTKGTVCDEIVEAGAPDGGKTVFGSPRNTLIYKQQGKRKPHCITEQLLTVHPF